MSIYPTSATLISSCSVLLAIFRRPARTIKGDFEGYKCMKLYDCNSKCDRLHAAILRGEIESKEHVKCFLQDGYAFF